YLYGTAPNEEGNCIIAGHNRYHGQMGLVSVLHKGLEVGDTVCVTTESGRDIYYTVESIDHYLYDAVPDSVMELGGEMRLTLITCLGDFDYDLRMSKTRVVAVCKPKA
ncbi:MAG: class F sortase, partial [Clostridia bacterium]|nr:class F sortase [Clostridia bacterium]